MNLPEREAVMRAFLIAGNYVADDGDKLSAKALEQMMQGALDDPESVRFYAEFERELLGFGWHVTSVLASR